MVALKHPHVEGLTVDKPADQVSKWETAGWLRVKPKAEPKKAEKPEQDDK